MTEEDKQRMIAELMRRGQMPGMDGQGQEFAQAPQGQPNDYSVVPIEMMADESRLITGSRNKDKIDPNDPNADILREHGKGGDSVGGGAGPSRGRPDPGMNPAMEGRRPPPSNVELPDALKKRWWE